MLYTEYVNKFLVDTSESFSPICRDFLLRRLTNEGIVGFSHGIGECHDAILSNLAKEGTIPDKVPFLPRGWKGDNPDPGRVLDFTGMFSKLQVEGVKPPPDWNSFLDRNREVSNFAGATWEDHLPLPRGYHRWIAHWLGPVPRIVYCKHGPGATSEKLRGWDKWLGLKQDRFNDKVIRMVDVPKDINKRRIIGIEPTRAQFIQQGISSALRTTPYFRRFINLTEQDVHCERAINDGIMTVDLKDASDRIPLSLLEYLFPKDWSDLIHAASTGLARLPCGRTHRLGMVATMGDGFCFEVETILFHLVSALCAGERALSDFVRHLERCFVYGDDVVLPRYLYEHWAHFCALSGWQMSTKKTCFTNEFKETVGYWITSGRARKRFLPRLTGDKVALKFEDDVARLALSICAQNAGYGVLSDGLISCRKFDVQWYPPLQRWEARVSATTSITRDLRVPGEDLYYAYWKCGLTEQLSEDTGITSIVRGWVPLDALPCLHKSINLCAPPQVDRWYRYTVDL